MNRISTVTFQAAGCSVPIQTGQTILHAVQEAGLTVSTGSLSAPCGGRGICRRCRVKAEGSALSGLTETEIKALSPGERAEGYRLACQARVLGSVEVAIPLETLGEAQLGIEGVSIGVIPNPPVSRCAVISTEASFENSQQLWQHVLGNLAVQQRLENVTIDPVLYGKEIPSIIREAVVTVRENEIINCFFNSSPPPPVGLAVDLGTTKIAGFLVNLETGEVLARGGIVNPQITFGSDLMARLTYALENEAHYRRLNQAVIEGINGLAAALTNQAGMRVTDIEEAVVAGNTAMHHLLLGLPVDQLARAPYLPAVTAPVQVKAREMGLAINPGAYVYAIPPVAGFVGGDHVAMILGSQLDRGDKVTLGLDIGTNTEIVLRYGQRLLSCSCASGPAFEGGHIQQGMQAARGAIQAVRLDGDGLVTELATVGGTAPVGICGSGMLDAVAELYRTGVINNCGQLNRSHPRVKLTEGGALQYTLVPASESGTGKDLVITKRDIEEILLAKAAIVTGIRLLLQGADLTPEDIQEVVVAGAFGSHLKVTSALVIGMFPSLSPALFHQVGNAAGAGTRAVLVSREERRRAERIAATIEHMELTTLPSFQDVYFSSLTLPRGDQ